MGKELECLAHHQGRTARVKALLETDSVILRGDIKATLPFSGLQRVQAQEGQLWLDDTVLDLGADAEKWAHKILHPPSLLDKLGIKHGMTVAVLNFSDRSFLKDHDHHTCLKRESEYDVILLHSPALNELRDLHKIKHAVGKKTMLWIVYPKGRRDITERQVFVHGKAMGLVDVKVCRFSDTLTALKFVRPKLNPK
jgi:hypothetical protein